MQPDQSRRRDAEAGIERIRPSAAQAVRADVGEPADRCDQGGRSREAELERVLEIDIVSVVPERVCGAALRGAEYFRKGAIAGAEPGRVADRADDPLIGGEARGSLSIPWRSSRSTRSSPPKAKTAAAQSRATPPVISTSRWRISRVAPKHATRMANATAELDTPARERVRIRAKPRQTTAPISHQPRQVIPISRACRAPATAARGAPSPASAKTPLPHSRRAAAPQPPTPAASTESAGCCPTAAARARRAGRRRS